MTLDHYSDHSTEPNDPTQCDCGRPKFGGNECCSRCGYMDGQSGQIARVISVLRTAPDWLSEVEIAREMGRASKSPPHLALMELMATGRVVREWRAVEAVDSVTRCRYGTGLKKCRTGGSGHYVYSLATRRGM